MLLHIADTICEAECSEEGQKFIIELSPWEASIVLGELPVEPDYASTQCLVGLLQRALQHVPAPEDPNDPN